jgi:hypothetical protein
MSLLMRRAALAQVPWLRIYPHLAKQGKPPRRQAFTGVLYKTPNQQPGFRNFDGPVRLPSKTAAEIKHLTAKFHTPKETLTRWSAGL